MSVSEMLAILLILANAVITYQGLSQPAYMERYAFRIRPIREGKDYLRLLSSGFLHVNWIHFFFNMYALYSFSMAVGYLFGIGGFILLYFGSLLGGNLLALYFRRHDPEYSAVGASGAVSGLIFAYILILPTAPIELFFILKMPAWVLGLAFLAFTLYGVKTRAGNIGHEAHLGGALVGVLIALALRPDMVLRNWWMLLLIVIPTAVFFYISLSHPEWVLLDGLTGKKAGKQGQYWSRNYSRASDPGRRQQPSGRKTIIDLKPNASGKSGLSPQEELDMLLDKVRLKGMDKLSKQERARLEELSKGLS